MASESSDETVFRAMLAQNCWFETSYHPVATALGHRYFLRVFEARAFYHFALRALLSLSLALVSKLTDRYGLILGLGIASGAQLMHSISISFETLSLCHVHA
jgi:hypothetical protein